MRAIDADHLKRWILSRVFQKLTVSDAIDQIDREDTIEPEIVRCKDCKHSEHWYRDKSRCFLWHEEGIDVFEDGFCNYAERRTDG